MTPLRVVIANSMSGTGPDVATSMSAIGTKRTLAFVVLKSAFDPKRTC